MCWSPALVKSGGRVPKTKAIVFWRHRLESDSLEFANLGGGREAGLAQCARHPRESGLH